jgi:hypothetical protein
LERLGRTRFNQRFVDPPILGKIGAVAVNRLLKVADHAEMPGPRRIGFGLKPIAGGRRRAG